MSDERVIRADSREHVEAWFELERLVLELRENADSLDGAVWDAETAAEVGRPDLAGQKVSVTGLPPSLVEPMQERIRAVMADLKGKRPPSPQALTNYYLEVLAERMQRLEDGQARMEERL